MGIIGQWLNDTFLGFDLSVFAFFASINCDFLTSVFKVFSSLGEVKFWVAIAVFAIVLAFFAKTRKIAFVLLMVCLLSVVVNGFLLKYGVARIRPYNTLQWHQDYWSWYQAAGSVAENEYCFASGHTTTAFEAAFALLLYFTKDLKQKIWPWVFVIVAFFVGCSRIYFMVHYPTDVIAGAIEGTILGITSYYLGQAIYNRVQLIIVKRHKENPSTNKSIKKNEQITNSKLFFPVFITFGLLLCFVIGFSAFNTNFDGGHDKCSYHAEYHCQNLACIQTENPQTGQQEGYCRLHKP